MCARWKLEMLMCLQSLNGKWAALRDSFQSPAQLKRSCRHGFQTEQKIRSMTGLAAGQKSIIFRAVVDPDARHSQSNDLPRRCLAVCFSHPHSSRQSPFTLTVMMSQFSALLMRRRCVAPLKRSRMLRMPVVASRTSAATNARVSIQDTRVWHLTLVSIGLLSTVF